ncbi:MAG: hypothetical protein WCO94_03485 [Verrucomicrobiota bacterium]
MKTYLNVISGLLTLTAGAQQGIKKLDVFDDNFVLQVVPDSEIAGASGTLAAKVSGTYSGDPVVLDAAWTSLEAGGFEFVLDMTSEELLALFTGETPSITLMAQMTFTVGGNVRRTQKFDLLCSRPVYRAGEVTPRPTEAMPFFKLTAPDNSQWQISIENDGTITRTKLT